MAAMENHRIKAHLVDANEFKELSEYYQVSGVPLTVIDGKRHITFVGRYPEDRFIAELLKAVE